MTDEQIATLKRCTEDLTRLRNEMMQYPHDVIHRNNAEALGYALDSLTDVKTRSAFWGMLHETV